MCVFTCVFVSVSALVLCAQGSGRLIEPAMRSSMWRFYDHANINFNDHTLNCGGAQIQHRLNGGRCGVCGDPYSQAAPRDNEYGGRYADPPLLARRYRMGSKVTMVVDLLAPRGGYFQMKLCARDRADQIVTQRCFDQYPLGITNGNNKIFRVQGRSDEDHGLYKLEVQLPAGVSCTHCVIQWHYRTDETQRSAMMSNADTDFINCADVIIGYNGDREAAPGQPRDLSKGNLAARIRKYRVGAHGTNVSPKAVNKNGKQKSNGNRFAGQQDLYRDDDANAGGGFPNLFALGGGEDFDEGGGFNMAAVMMGMMNGNNRGGNNRQRQSFGGGSGSGSDESGQRRNYPRQRQGRTNAYNIPSISRNRNYQNLNRGGGSSGGSSEERGNNRNYQNFNGRPVYETPKPDINKFKNGLKELADHIIDTHRNGGGSSSEEVPTFFQDGGSEENNKEDQEYMDYYMEGGYTHGGTEGEPLAEPETEPEGAVSEPEPTGAEPTDYPDGGDYIPGGLDQTGVPEPLPIDNGPVDNGGVVPNVPGDYEGGNGGYEKPPVGPNVPTGTDGYTPTGGPNGNDAGSLGPNGNDYTDKLVPGGAGSYKPPIEPTPLGPTGNGDYKPPTTPVIENPDAGVGGADYVDPSAQPLTGDGGDYVDPYDGIGVPTDGVYLEPFTQLPSDLTGDHNHGDGHDHGLGQGETTHYITNGPDMSPWMQHYLMGHQVAGGGWGGLGMSNNYQQSYKGNLNVDQYNAAAIRHNMMHDAVKAQLNPAQFMPSQLVKQMGANNINNIFSWMPSNTQMLGVQGTTSRAFASAASNHYLSSYMSMTQTHPASMCGRPELLQCIATPNYRHIPDADAICTHKCRRGEACGEQFCSCGCNRQMYCVHSQSVQQVGMGAWTRQSTTQDQWCTQQCNGGSCPNNVCACHMI